jgi:ABC-2 type transport system permease protein
MLTALAKQGAFIRRGYLVESSYKAAFLMELMSSLFPLLSFFFIGKLIDGHSRPELESYGGEYFPFALVGVGLSQFFGKALSIFSDGIRRAQMSGVLEATLCSQTSPVTLVLYDSTFSFLMASAHLFFVFLVGGTILGADYSSANVVALVLSGVLAVWSFVGLGVMGAAAIISFKKGDPIQFIFGSGASVLSGAYFPLSVLPEPLRGIAEFLPMTHALECIRLALFEGATVARLASPLATLATMAIVLLPASLWLFHWSVENGRRDGTLLHY